MDSEKVPDIFYWPLPNVLKATQRFPGVTNYCQYFINNYFVLSPRKMPNLKHWSPYAIEVFHDLKWAFHFGPVLTRSDITKPFYIRVYASLVGVDAIFFQSPMRGNYPCTIFPKNSPQQRRIILGLRCAQYQTNSWGSTSSDCCRLNPSQAHWFLFFSEFD